jgi:hypothetical protein
MLVGMESSPTERTSGGGGDPTWQRALYELGRDFESLLSLVPSCYLLAESGEPFPRSISHHVTLVHDHLSSLVSQFDGTELGPQFEQFRDGLLSAGEHLEHSWLDEQHERLLGEWIKADAEFVPDEWWDQIPAHGGGGDRWHEVRQLLDDIQEKLSDSDTRLLAFGRLYTRVAHTVESPGGLNADSATTKLVAELRRMLPELRSQLGDHPGLDVELLLPPVDDHATQLNRRALKDVDRVLRRVLVNSNGPVAPSWFWWNGNQYQVRQPLIWRLIDFLWQAATRSAEFEELAEHVWQDHATAMTDGTTGSARTKANRFFQDHGIPLKVTVIGRRFVLEEIAEQ